MGEWLGGVNPAMIWAVFALVLALAELIVPGVFLVWIAIAAAITAGATLILPFGAPIQLLIFAIFSAFTVSGGRLWYLAQPDTSSDPLLNDRSARLIGQVVTVSEAIVQGQGRVRVDDSSWPASGPDAPAGARLTIVDVRGSTLIVDHPAA